MSARSRGIVPLMTEVANEMWREAADAFGDRNRVSDRLAKADEEMDIFHQDLTREVVREEMPVTIAAQVTLLARFYEHLATTPSTSLAASSSLSKPTPRTHLV